MCTTVLSVADIKIGNITILMKFFHCWLHQKFSFWQHLTQFVTKVLYKGWCSILMWLSDMFKVISSWAKWIMISKSWLCLMWEHFHRDHLVVVVLFPTEYKQWRTEHMSNITTTINIDDPVGGHQRSQRLIGLATTSSVLYLWSSMVKQTQIAKFVGPTWGPPESCWPQMGPMLAPWTLLSGKSLSVLEYVLHALALAKTLLIIREP